MPITPTRRPLRVLALAGATAASLSLAACANTSAGAGEDDDTPTVIRVAAGVGAPPYADFAEDGKTVIGYEPDILAAIAAEAGYEIETTVLDFDAMFPSLESGRTDLISYGIIDRTNRQEKYDILDNAKDAAGVAGSPEVVANITSLDDVCGHRVGVSSGTSFVGFLEEYSATCTADGGEPIEVLTFKNEAVALTALTAGQVDLVSTQYPILANFAATSGGDIEVAKGISFLEGYAGFVFPKDSPYLEDFTEALQELIDSGEYDAIMQKWGLGDLAVTSADINQGTAE